ncbi:MAG: hypothetical protein J07HX64_02270 [halophilic archaeon J07HX64]|nr:MAG: hypothetical protein J07HX64_02270 [halophilic archaeon J07HX64]
MSPNPAYPESNALHSLDRGVTVSISTTVRFNFEQYAFAVCVIGPTVATTS